MHTPVRVLFVCDGGSARSRMAKGLLRSLGGDRFEVHSAGIEGEVLNPLAIEVMREMGITLDNTPTPALNEFEDIQFDYVITLCDEAKSTCLAFPRDGYNLHWTCPDPTIERGKQAEQIEAFRRTGAQLQQFINHWMAEVNEYAG